uniref:NTF2 domain-containing protein n=1 Tax=Loxodonta africana TaxID=9785 RepID=G3TXA8_LOXAF
HSAHYTIPTYRQRGSCRRGDQAHGNMERERKPPQEGMQENRQDGTSRSWFKVTFPSGVKYDEKWLQNLIQSLCTVPFNLIEFPYQKMQAQFLVENASIAFELKKVSSKICIEDKERISIFVRPFTVPYSEQKELKSTKVKLIKVTRIKGYEVPQQALDLQRVHSDPDATIHDIEMGRNFGNCMAASLQIIEENTPKLLSFNSSNNTPHQLLGLPDTMQKAPNIRSLNLSKNEVKSEEELDKVKAVLASMTWASSVITCFSLLIFDSSILELFPKLLCLILPSSSLASGSPWLRHHSSLAHGPSFSLTISVSHSWSALLTSSSLPKDNREVPPPIVFGTEASKKLPVCKGSIFGSETLKNLILEFLQQYYRIYDHENRWGLLGAYHNEACFSLTHPFNPEDLVQSWLDKNSKGNRNIKKLKDTVLWVQLLKHTKRDVVDFLSVLPKTQHVVSSLVVDMCVHSEKMLCFSVSRVFKDVEGMSPAHVRAFTRIIIATPSSNFSLCIMNDQLCVGDLGLAETQGAFFTLEPTPSSSSVPTLSQEQQELVPVFTAQSGMSLE